MTKEELSEYQDKIALAYKLGFDTCFDACKKYGVEAVERTKEKAFEKVMGKYEE